MSGGTNGNIRFHLHLIGNKCFSCWLVMHAGVLKRMLDRRKMRVSHLQCHASRSFLLSPSHTEGRAGRPKDIRPSSMQHLGLRDVAEKL